MTDDHVAEMRGQMDKLRAEGADMRRQMGDLIQERTTLRHAMHQIRTYQGSRYVDDCAVFSVWP